MNKTVAVRMCGAYDLQEVYNLISDIYSTCEGPDVSGKKVLVKPNILNDSDPSKCICTHPVVVEAMIRFLQSKGAVVSVGDSPAVHMRALKVRNQVFTRCVRKPVFLGLISQKILQKQLLKKGK